MITHKLMGKITILGNWVKLLISTLDSQVMKNKPTKIKQYTLYV